MPDLHRLITAAGALLLYLPAYGNDKQPVEKAFSKTRLWLARNREISRSDPRLAIRRACMSVTHRDASGYFQSCGIETN
jgi:transposase